MKKLLNYINGIFSINYCDQISQPFLIGKTVIARKPAKELNIPYRKLEKDNIFLRGGDELVILKIDDNRIFTDRLPHPINSNVFNTRYFNIKK